MAKRFVRTNKNFWDSFSNKSAYNDSIVFIEDTKQIYSNGIYYGGDQLIEISYNDLKNLRDNSELIPGMQYRIIDYNTTTTQGGTKSAGHQFDIIVTADSENVLNENARAIQHESEGIDYNETIYDSDKLTNDFFISWGIETEPNTGVDTLCIYKTDVTGINDESEEYDSNYAGIDFSDVFFYIGNYEYNDEWFDVWLKCEIYNNEYLVNGDNLHYYLTTPIVENGLIKPELYDEHCSFYDPFHADYIISVHNNNLLFHTSNYFFNSNLSAWELKYTIDNDTSRFVWADTENGKGVIYYMKDEYNNECPYDFKNILFLRSATWFNDNKDWCNSVIGGTPTISEFYYTFTWLDGNIFMEDLSIVGNTSLYDDEGVIKGVFNNTIKSCPKSNISSCFTLPDNVFVSSYYFDSGPFYGCYYNTLSDSCSSNTFGNICCYNTLGNNCCSNTFCNGCKYNTFSNYCINNLFGNGYEYNLLGNNCNYIKFITTDSKWSSGYKYYKFASGLQGLSANNMLEITLLPHLEYLTCVAKRTNGEIVIYNEADLVPWTYIVE